MAPKKYSSKNQTLSNDDLKRLFEICGGAVEMSFIQQVAKAHSYNANAVSNALITLAERQTQESKKHTKPQQKQHNRKTETTQQKSRNSSNKSSTENLSQKSKVFRNQSVKQNVPKAPVNNTLKSANQINNQSVNQNVPKEPVNNTMKSPNQVNNTGAVPKRPQQQQTQKNPAEIEFDRTVALINTGAKVVVILRGAPGSGKSYMANQIYKRTVGHVPANKPSNHIFSTDNYFEFINGGYYAFNPMLLPAAHEWNQNRCRGALISGVSPVIVDNTNIKYWEMKYYIIEALKYGYVIKVLVPFTVWWKNTSQLFHRCVHHVPKAKIVEMVENFDPHIDTNMLLSLFNLIYPPGVLVPQLRNFPPYTSGSEFQNVKTVEQKGSRNEASKPQAEAVTPKKKTSNVPSTEDLLRNIPKEILNEDVLEDEIVRVPSNHSDGVVIRYSGEDLLNMIPGNVKQNKLIQKIMNEKPKPQRQKTDKKKTNDAVVPSEKTEQENEATLVEWLEDENVSEEHLLSVNVPLPSAKPLSPFKNPSVSLLDEPIIEDLPKVNIPPPSLSTDPEDFITLQPKTLPEQPRKESFLDTFKSFFSNLNNPKTIPVSQMEIPISVITEHFEVSTNTCNKDFASILTLDTENTISVPNMDYQRLIVAENRNINEDYVPSTTNVPPRKLMLDKGSQVEEWEEPGDLKELMSIFPDVAKRDLKHILDQCQGQVSWAVDILLDTPRDKLGKGDDNDENEDDKEDVIKPMSAVEIREFENAIEPSDDTEKEVWIQYGISEENKAKLKKLFEERFVIDDSHYSENLLQIRNFRHAELHKDTSSTEEVDSFSESEESTDIDGSDEDECIELKLNFEFIDSLNKLMGHSYSIPFPDGLKPVINVPKSLAQQLHLLWLESYFQQVSSHEEQLERMFKEDEEFARQLQMKENELNAAGTLPNVATVQDLITMEIDLEIAKRIQTDELAQDKYEDLATRLTQQKLFDMFPEIPRDTIQQVLLAFDNRYDQTVELLRSDVGESSSSLEKPGDGRAQEKQLLAEARRVSSEVNELKNPHYAESTATNKTAEDYRQMAESQLRLRKECLEKARSMYTRGLTSGAAYYSELAQLHKNKFEYANRCGATLFVSEQINEGCPGGTVLDLHYLSVKEAKFALDTFIDKHIDRLMSNGKKSVNLYAITGRGLNSAGGEPKIKPAIMRLLTKRGLRSTFINPGLLRFKVHNYDNMTEA